MKQITDFYNYCNEIYNNKKIPDDQPSKSNFSDIANSNNNKLIELLDNIDESSFDNKLLKTIYNKKINFSSLSMNEQIETCNKIQAIIEQILNNNSLIEKITMLNNVVNIFISYHVAENPTDGHPYILEINSGDLTFSKDYYIDDKFKKELDGFKEYRYDVLNYLKNTYKVFNYLDIDTINKDVEYIENLLSPYILSNERSRDVVQRINKIKLNDLINKFPNINFDNEHFLYNYHLKDKNNTDIIFESNLNNCKILSKDKPDQYDLDNGDYYWYFINDLFYKYKNDKFYFNKINNYIIWRVINCYVPYICEDLRLKQFYFNAKYFTGQKVEKPIKILAIKYLINVLPELIGNLFCQKYFTKDHKNLMDNLINYLLISSEFNFNFRCKWMDKNSIENAIKKIKKLYINKKVGYPEKETYNYKYSQLKNLIECVYNNDNINNMTLFEFKNILVSWYDMLNVEKLNKKSIDITEWEMSSVETNAYFHPLKNEIVFPAGILQEPFFFFLTKDQLYSGRIIDKSDDNISELLEDRIRLSKDFPSLNTITMASNFGSIGAVIGHEISHSFDDNGSKFDEHGKLNEWWSESVKKNYENITNKIVKQFDNYFIDIDNDKFFINGKLTLGENIADLFGLKIAIDAYKIFYKENKENKGNGKTLKQGLRELFVSFANTWRYVESKEQTKSRIVDDVHSPPKFRVNGTIQNIKDFYKVFEQKSDNKIIKVFL